MWILYTCIYGRRTKKPKGHALFHLKLKILLNLNIFMNNKFNISKTAEILSEKS